MLRTLTNHKMIFLAAAMIVVSQRSISEAQDLAGSEAQDRAGERGDVPFRASAKLYGGDPLEVWHQRLGELKPESPYAAVLAPGLQEIVEDAQAPDAFRGSRNSLQ